MKKMKVGEVYSYDTWDGSRHCREEIAIVRRRSDGTLYATDTFWGGGTDSHVLTKAELETRKLLFDTADFRDLGERERWEDFHPNDRRAITSQHGLRSQELVRLGAKPDLATKILNARDRVEEAQANLRSATLHLQWAEQARDALLLEQKEAAALGDGDHAE